MTGVSTKAVKATKVWIRELAGRINPTFLFPVRPVIILKLLVSCLTALTALLLTYSCATWCWHTFCKTVWSHRNNRNSVALWHQSADGIKIHQHIIRKNSLAVFVCNADIKNELNVLGYGWNERKPKMIWLNVMTTKLPGECKPKQLLQPGVLYIMQ